MDIPKVKRPKPPRKASSRVKTRLDPTIVSSLETRPITAGDQMRLSGIRRMVPRADVVKPPSFSGTPTNWADGSRGDVDSRAERYRERIAENFEFLHKPFHATAAGGSTIRDDIVMVDGIAEFKSQAKLEAESFYQRLDIRQRRLALDMGLFGPGF